MIDEGFRLEVGQRLHSDAFGVVAAFEGEVVRVFGDNQSVHLQTDRGDVWRRFRCELSEISPMAGQTAPGES